MKNIRNTSYTLQANSGTDPRLVLLIDRFFIILTFDAIRTVIAQSDGWGSVSGRVKGSFIYSVMSSNWKTNIFLT